MNKLLYIVFWREIIIGRIYSDLKYKADENGVSVANENGMPLFLIRSNDGETPEFIKNRILEFVKEEEIICNTDEFVIKKV